MSTQTATAPCVSCGTNGTEDNPVTLEEDPYAAEIQNNHTEVWECGNCRYESGMDI